MILIADSGSTKTEWVVCQKNLIPKRFRCMGLNPYYVDQESIEKELRKELLPFLDEEAVTQIFFYGAGCSLDSKKFVVEDALMELFKNADVHVESDLLGASRALMGNETGIACILGTGSNSCLFDGEKIAVNLPSLGYILGDEGSGAHIGKKLVRHYLLEEMPNELRKAFDKSFNYSKENIMNAVYRQPLPNRFLASFSVFIAEQIKNSFINSLVLNSFTEFFEAQLLKYEGHERLPCNFVGSIAFHFSDQLKQIARQFGVDVRKIKQSPVEGLISYHFPDQ